MPIQQINNSNNIIEPNRPQKTQNIKHSITHDSGSEMTAHYQKPNFVVRKIRNILESRAL